MGEYYFPCLFTETPVMRTVDWSRKKIEDTQYLFKWYYSHSYKETITREDGASFEISEGLKMMEHAYFGGDMVNHVISDIVNKSSRKADIRLIWMSDYGRSVSKEVDKSKQYYLDVAQVAAGMEWFDKNRAQPKMDCKFRNGYIINTEKDQYISVRDHAIKNELRETSWEEYHNINICPLCLLTQYNEGGGGNYYGTNEKLIGTWALDKIQYQTKLPPEDMECLDGVFREQGVKYI